MISTEGQHPARGPRRPPQALATARADAEEGKSLRSFRRLHWLMTVAEQAWREADAHLRLEAALLQIHLSPSGAAPGGAATTSRRAA